MADTIPFPALSLTEPSPPSPKTQTSPSINPTTAPPSIAAPEGTATGETTTSTPTDDRRAAHHAAAIRQLHGTSSRTSHRHASSTTDPSRRSPSTQPVLVRTYSKASSSAAKGNKGNETRERQSAGNVPNVSTVKSSSQKDAKLPPVEAFSFKNIMDTVEPEIKGTLDVIAGVCAKSRYSLAGQYEVHLPPHQQRIGQMDGVGMDQETEEEERGPTNHLAGAGVESRRGETQPRITLNEAPTEDREGKRNEVSRQHQDSPRPSETITPAAVTVPSPSTEPRPSTTSAAQSTSDQASYHPPEDPSSPPSATKNPPSWSTTIYHTATSWIPFLTNSHSPTHSPSHSPFPRTNTTGTTSHDTNPRTSHDTGERGERGEPPAQPADAEMGRERCDTATQTAEGSLRDLMRRAIFE
ncbi:MAG: hypothetical protein M1817_000520 [Caeruleum heppii]|nr:MAG: hypothetical protein M1817_000520 [Caeruleum heppii]